MDFRIADTFTDSLARLTGEEQRAAKTAAFDLQVDPSHPGLKLHKIEKAKDPGFLSVRVSRDLRLILHRADESVLLCYVDHHDKAYEWARRRRLETHPKTGAAQLVEVRETVREIEVPKYVEVERERPLLFGHLPAEELLSYGVPVDWLGEVRQATEDTLLEVATRLPAEAGEALLALAMGEKPAVPTETGGDPFAHPDALRRFRLMGDVEELRRALEYPWEKWTIFLHPEQRKLVEREFRGAARVAGSAGTGKTIVALHRAAFLARSERDARVLMTTFSETLANALRTKLRRLTGSEPRLLERIEVHSMDAVGRRLYESRFGRPRIAAREAVRELLVKAAEAEGEKRFTPRFLVSEWEAVADAWRLESWEAYRDVARLGRKTRLPEKRREVLWAIFERVRAGLREQDMVTQAGVFHRLTESLADGKRPPFDFAVVDEAQDVSVPQLRFLAALGTGRPDALFFAGDLGQRIFQQPFSWRALGVDVRGRSSRLRINYRTSHQIRMQADRLLGPELSDVDGIMEERRGTQSTFNGPEPEIRTFGTAEEESRAVGEWIAARIGEGVAPEEVGVFVRSKAELERAKAAVEVAGAKARVLDEKVETAGGCISLSTMHLAKGLEFRAVAAMACDDEVIPSQGRIERVADEGDLEDVYNTERHLLYVACTRARDFLLVTGVEPGSEFLDDLGLEG